MSALHANSPGTRDTCANVLDDIDDMKCPFSDQRPFGSGDILPEQLMPHCRKTPSQMLARCTG